MAESSANIQSVVKHVLARFGLENGQIEAVLKQNQKETDALENWQTLYEEEHAQRLQDTADLINKVQELQCEIKRMKERMAKVKVKDL